MALNIISNFAANVATRNLARTDAQVTASLSKLSSGTRVVSAKDDAASLAIGSRLRAEVAGLKQASVNAGQASSLLQIADGALATTSDILVRMKALAVQSSSGQLSSTERTVLNAEFVALRDEIDRISNDTEFNGTTLLKGADLNTTNELTNLSNVGIQSVLFDTGIHTADNNAYRIEFTASSDTLTIQDLAGAGPTVQSIVLSSAQITAIDALVGTETLDITVGTTGITVRFDANFDSTVDFRENSTNNLVAANADITAFGGATLAYDNAITIAGIDALAAQATFFEANGSGYNAETGILRIAIQNDASANKIDILATTGFTFSATNALAAAATFTVTFGGQSFGTVTLGTITSSTTTTVGGFIEVNIGQGIVDNTFAANGGSTSFTFQIGTGTTTNTDDVTFAINTASSSALGISSSNILNSTAAKSSITAVGSAIDTVNSGRADVGAAQNRLDFASSNLAASIENAEAARSQLLDLDIASEITTFTSKQVLLQAGVAMLAQANQLPQNLLRLLQ